MLIAGYDSAGPHIFETTPSGNFYEHFAAAIGRRSQSAKTYLEKHFESFPGLNKEDLLLEALRSLSKCIDDDEEMNAESISVAIVGEGVKFTILNEQELKQLIARVNQ